MEVVARDYWIAFVLREEVAYFEGEEVVAADDYDVVVDRVFFYH